MSFDRRYPKRKDWRDPYRDTRRFDRGCRHGGACTYCSKNRTFSNRRREPLPDTLQEEHDLDD